MGMEPRDATRAGLVRRALEICRLMRRIADHWPHDLGCVGRQHLLLVALATRRTPDGSGVHGCVTIFQVALETRIFAISPLAMKHHRICQGGTKLDVHKVDEMEILGARLSSDGNSLSSLRHRLGRATACFWKLCAAFREPSLSLTRKLTEFSNRVHATALYGAGARTWSQSLYTEVYRF